MIIFFVSALSIAIWTVCNISFVGFFGFLLLISDIVCQDAFNLAKRLYPLMTELNTELKSVKPVIRYIATRKSSCYKSNDQDHLYKLNEIHQILSELITLLKGLRTSERKMSSLKHNTRNIEEALDILTLFSKII